MTVPRDETDAPYEPWDQGRLGEPPWSPDDPKIQAWEAAHGHDVRLKCYAEFGCLVIEPALERQVASLQSQLTETRDQLR